MEMGIASATLEKLAKAFFPRRNLKLSTVTPERKEMLANFRVCFVSLSGIWKLCFSYVNSASYANSTDRQIPFPSSFAPKQGSWESDMCFE